MNTLNKSSIALFSITLLLSVQLAHAGFADLYQAAGKYAQSLWANRPAMPSVSLPNVQMPKLSMPSLPAISLPKVSIPTLPTVSMPSISREHVEAGIEAVGNYAQKAEILMGQYPKTTMVAQYIPLIAAMAYVGVKSYGQSAYAQSKANAIEINSRFNASNQAETKPLDGIVFYR